ncbi:hypothetical protein B0T17DRAFT_482062 [Bombardia bombarda]|uniref:Endosomal spry domain-containing protein n=1 Tax=Bombardia bombarda TaxID=252184 RepID=A0AA39XKK6_9PEZI|nr:hypothetical protein B0T17DRAFT_482062 [Bombardia bombarda]
MAPTLSIFKSLVARIEIPPDAQPVPGAILPQAVNNNALFALFGIIGAAFVVVGIWFFFWAKNGGFVFREDDWDDYKSTVLRRRGPNGTLLTGATPSTILGGGSVYKDVDDNNTEDTSTVVSGTTGITGITGGVSDIYGREKRRKKREQKEREKERRREEKAREKEEKRSGKSSARRTVGADGVLIDEQAEAEAKAQLRNYRHEKAARVGGINKESEGSSWDGSTNQSYSTTSGSGIGASTVGGGDNSTVTSELIPNRERTPTKKEKHRDPEKKPGGIRKVYSTADKTSARENERLRAEAKKLQREQEKSSRVKRDFSFQRGADDMRALRPIEEGTDSIISEPRASASRSTPRVHESSAYRAPPSSYTESDLGTDMGTKVYRHSVHIPVSVPSSSSAPPSSVAPSSTATSDFAYQEEKRKKRAAGGGYRRARGGDGESGL